MQHRRRSSAATGGGRPLTPRSPTSGRLPRRRSHRRTTSGTPTSRRSRSSSRASSIGGAEELLQQEAAAAAEAAAQQPRTAVEAIVVPGATALSATVRPHGFAMLDEDTMLFQSGDCLCSLALGSKESRTIAFQAGFTLTAFAVHEKKRLVAVSFAGKATTTNVYSFPSWRRVAALEDADGDVLDLISAVAFSESGELLSTVVNRRDCVAQHVCVWDIVKTRILCGEFLFLEDQDGDDEQEQQAQEQEEEEQEEKKQQTTKTSGVARAKAGKLLEDIVESSSRSANATSTDIERPVLSMQWSPSKGDTQFTVAGHDSIRVMSVTLHAHDHVLTASKVRFVEFESVHDRSTTQLTSVGWVHGAVVAANSQGEVYAGRPPSLPASKSTTTLVRRRSTVTINTEGVPQTVVAVAAESTAARVPTALHFVGQPAQTPIRCLTKTQDDLLVCADDGGVLTVVRTDTEQVLHRQPITDEIGIVACIPIPGSASLLVVEATGRVLVVTLTYTPNKKEEEEEEAAQDGDEDGEKAQQPSHGEEKYDDDDDNDDERHLVAALQHRKASVGEWDVLTETVFQFVTLPSHRTIASAATLNRPPVCPLHVQLVDSATNTGGVDVLCTSARGSIVRASYVPGRSPTLSALLQMPTTVGLFHTTPTVDDTRRLRTSTIATRDGRLVVSGSPGGVVSVSATAATPEDASPSFVPSPAYEAVKIVFSQRLHAAVLHVLVRSDEAYAVSIGTDLDLCWLSLSTLELERMHWIDRSAPVTIRAAAYLLPKQLFIALSDQRLLVVDDDDDDDSKREVSTYNLDDALQLTDLVAARQVPSGIDLIAATADKRLVRLALASQGTVAVMQTAPNHRKPGSVARLVGRALVSGGFDGHVCVRAFSNDASWQLGEIERSETLSAPVHDFDSGGVISVDARIVREGHTIAVSSGADGGLFAFSLEAAFGKPPKAGGALKSAAATHEQLEEWKPVALLRDADDAHDVDTHRLVGHQQLPCFRLPVNAGPRATWASASVGQAPFLRSDARVALLQRRRSQLELRSDVERGLEELREHVAALVAANAAAPELERLDAMEFAVDPSFREQLTTYCTSRVDRERAKIRRDNIVRELLYHRTKKQCWDSMETHSVVLHSFERFTPDFEGSVLLRDPADGEGDEKERKHSDSDDEAGDDDQQQQKDELCVAVSNIPIRKTSAAQKRRWAHIAFLRQMEAREREWMRVHHAPPVGDEVLDDGEKVMLDLTGKEERPYVQRCLFDPSVPLYSAAECVTQHRKLTQAILLEQQVLFLRRKFNKAFDELLQRKEWLLNDIHDKIAEAIDVEEKLYKLHKQVERAKQLALEREERRKELELEVGQSDATVIRISVNNANKIKTTPTMQPTSHGHRASYFVPSSRDIEAQQEEEEVAKQRQEEERQRQAEKQREKSVLHERVAASYPLPELHLDEQPELLVTEGEDEVGRRHRKNDHDGPTLTATNRAALEEMMGGRLEMDRGLEELGKEMVREPWMDLPEARMTDEQKQAFAVFVRKEVTLEHSRQVALKTLNSQLKKLRSDLDELRRQFAASVQALFTERLAVQGRIYGIHTWLLALRRAVVEGRARDRRVRETRKRVDETRADEKRHHPLCASFQVSLESEQARLDELRGKEKQLDRRDTFRHDFHDVGDGIDALYKLYKQKQPARQGTDFGAHAVNQNRLTIHTEDLARRLCVLRSPHDAALISADEVKAEVRRSQVAVSLVWGSTRVARRGSIAMFVEDDGTWARLQERRRLRMELAVQVRLQSEVVGLMRARFAEMKRKDTFLKNEVRQLQRSLASLLEERARAEVDATLLLELAQGLVEVPQAPVASSLGDAIVCPRRDVEELNARVVKRAEENIAVLRETCEFRKGINVVKWKHESLQLELEEQRAIAQQLQLMKVTKRLQRLVREGGHQQHKTAQIEALERKIEFMKESKARELERRVEREAETRRRVDEVEAENERLKATIHERELLVQERLRVKHPTATSVPKLDLSRINAAAAAADSKSERRQRPHPPSDSKRPPAQSARVRKTTEQHDEMMKRNIWSAKMYARAKSLQREAQELREERDRLHEASFPMFAAPSQPISSGGSMSARGASTFRAGKTKKKKKKTKTGQANYPSGAATARLPEIKKNYD